MQLFSVMLKNESEIEPCKIHDFNAYILVKGLSFTIKNGEGVDTAMITTVYVRTLLAPKIEWGPSAVTPPPHLLPALGNQYSTVYKFGCSG